MHLINIYYVYTIKYMSKATKSYEITKFAIKSDTISTQTKPTTKSSQKLPIEDMIEPMDIFSSDEENNNELVDFEQDSSDDSVEEDNIVLTHHKIAQLRGNILGYIFINVKHYNFPNWSKYYPDKKVNILELFTNSRWQGFVDEIYTRKYIYEINDTLTKIIKEKREIVPYPQLLFNSFNCVSPNKLRVVIIGQDPYPCFETHTNIKIPHASGFSFNLPFGCKQAKTFHNIVKNLKKYNHVDNDYDVESGSLSYWVLQGVFLFNSALTTILTKSNVHTKLWKDFSKDFISYINNNMKDIVFLVWGRDAYNICKNIDTSKHHLIISSHPSPLAFNKTFSVCETKGKYKNKKKVYPEFCNCDHFGLANQWLISKGKNPIIWHIP